MQLDFWTEFKKYGKENNSKLRFRKPFPQHWYDISIGDSRAHLALSTDTRNNEIRCEFYIPDNKELFNQLESHKPEIESLLDYELEWMYLEGKKASRIKATAFANFSKAEKWNEYFAWALEVAENFQKIFQSFLKQTD